MNRTNSHQNLRIRFLFNKKFVSQKIADIYEVRRIPAQLQEVVEEGIGVQPKGSPNPSSSSNRRSDSEMHSLRQTSHTHDEGLVHSRSPFYASSLSQRQGRFKESSGLHTRLSYGPSKRTNGTSSFPLQRSSIQTLRELAVSRTLRCRCSGKYISFQLLFVYVFFCRIKSLLACASLSRVTVLKFVLDGVRSLGR